MATLHLDRIWVNRLDTGQGISGYSAIGRQRTKNREGQPVNLASGRIRSMTTGGVGGTFAFGMRALTLSTVEELEDWAGIAVQVRDHRGQRFFGAYYEVATSEFRVPNLYDVAITLRLLTIAEGV